VKETPNLESWKGRAGGMFGSWAETEDFDWSSGGTGSGLPRMGLVWAQAAATRIKAATAQHGMVTSFILPFPEAGPNSFPV
jgi:hypothetical protein